MYPLFAGAIALGVHAWIAFARRPASEGEIAFEGKSIGHIAARDFHRSPFRKDIQIVFQDPNDSLNPRFTAFSTWNDYLEGSYLGGPYPRNALWPNYRGNEFSHDAFREIAKYYLDWYKTGRQPQITTDLIAIAHRLATLRKRQRADPIRLLLQDLAFQPQRVAHGFLDLALRGDAYLLEETAQASIEDVFVHEGLLVRA